MGGLRKWKRHRSWKKPPGRGKVGLSGLRWALVRERRAKSHVNPRPEARRRLNPVRTGWGGQEWDSEHTVGDALTVLRQTVGACGERSRTCLFRAADHWRALLGRPSIQQPSPCPTSLGLSRSLSHGRSQSGEWTVRSGDNPTAQWRLICSRWPLSANNATSRAPLSRCLAQVYLGPTRVNEACGCSLVKAAANLLGENWCWGRLDSG